MSKEIPLHGIILCNGIFRWRGTPIMKLYCLKIRNRYEILFSKNINPFHFVVNLKAKTDYRHHFSYLLEVVPIRLQVIYFRSGL